jgi:hypothetical protein
MNGIAERRYDDETFGESLSHLCVISRRRTVAPIWEVTLKSQNAQRAVWKRPSAKMAALFRIVNAWLVDG